MTLGREGLKGNSERVQTADCCWEYQKGEVVGSKGKRIPISVEKFLLKITYPR